MKFTKLIKLEIFKYKDNSLVQMLLLFFTILMPTAIFVMKYVNIPMLPGANSYFTFPHVWRYQAYTGSWLSFFFLGYLGVYIITSEIQFKTLRQNIINGMTRMFFFKGKIYIIILVSLYATLLFFISTAIIGLLHQDAFALAEIFEKQVYVIPRFFLLTFAYMVFGMMIGYLIKKPGLSVFFYLSYILIIEPLFRLLVHGKSKASFYYPMNAIEDLAPLPLYKFVNIKLLSYSEAAAISIISVIVFIAISYYFFNRRDI